MAACDRCGAANDAGARFCSACGAALADALREGLEVRKTVTILFCDVVGSTSLGEATDPETTRKVMGRYAAAMTKVIEQHGGTVERFRGDEVMAVFGIPVTHEDDALRAVRAASAMQRRLQELNDELRATAGVELACRIGINTGEVVAGDPGIGETFVTGDAVNLAKRLEQAAEPGTILIGTATYPLVKEAVKVGPRRRFTAKGKREPVTRLELEHVDATAAGFARRLDAPLVNRVAELSTLRTLVHGAFAEERCRVVAVLGAAGIGKSRLVRELASELASVATVATGRCLPYGSGITFWPLQQVLTELGGLDGVSEVLAGTGDREIVLERLRAATGTGDDDVPGSELFWAVRCLLERVAERKPFLVLLDDVHWGEPTMLDLLEHVAAFARGPIVLVCVARPELLESRHSLAAAAVHVEQLSERDTAELVEALGVENAELRQRIISTSEGNPLFAEQLAAMIADSETAGAGELPASIHALLAARIDGLEPAERRMLERASIIGKEFWPRALADLSSEADRQELTSRLISLVRKGLVQPSRSELPGHDAYRFRHSLICDVAYAAMPKTVRAELHERFARWLQEPARAGTGFGEHEEILGYHLEQAYRYRTALAPVDDHAASLAAEAGRLLAAAGRRALGREDVPAAAALLERAADLLPQGAPARLETLRDAAFALWEAGDAARGAECLERLRGEADSAGNEEIAAVAELERIAHEQLTGTDVDAVRRAAERVVEHATASSDHATAARAWRRLSAAHRRVGAFGAAETAARQALDHARRAGDRREEARAVDALCNCLLYGPTPAPDALASCDDLLAQDGVTPTLEANVLSLVSALRSMLGDVDSARAAYARAAAIYEELGLELARAALTQLGVPLELLAGDAEAAEREARLGEEIFARFDSGAIQTPLIAEALVAQGRLGEAEDALRAVPPDEGPTIVQWQVRWRIVTARLETESGNGERAVDLARDAVGLAEQTEDVTLHADALASYGHALSGAGREDEAAPAWEQARALYQAKGHVAGWAALSAHVAP